MTTQTTEQNKPLSLEQVLTFLENRITAYSREIRNGREDYKGNDEIRVYRAYTGVLE